MKRAFTISQGIASDPIIPLILDRQVIKGLGRAGLEDSDVIIGWGRKDNTKRARTFARDKGLPYLSLEDGFIGYLSHPDLDNRRVSLIVDHSGIYYDARSESDLEKLIADDSWFTEVVRWRASELMQKIVDLKISKYNHAVQPLSAVTQDAIRSAKIESKTIRLLVDQVKGDKGIELGLAGQDSFDTMLADALKDQDCLLLIKTHPDVVLGKKKGCLNLAALPAGCDYHIIDDACAPMDLLQQVDEVYVVTSQMGFDALMAGKLVHCYGMPFYAGWGLTIDHKRVERRSKKRDLEHIFAAAFLRYTQYACPYTHQPCDLDYIIELITADRCLPRLKAHRIYAVGFSLWKRKFMPNFLAHQKTEIIWVSGEEMGAIDYKASDAILYWGRRFDQKATALPEFVDVWRVEDGFLRSVGLGSDLRRPASLVIEKRGIYYDSRSESAIENFLNTHRFTLQERRRAQELRRKLVKTKVSKYNVGQKLKSSPLKGIKTKGRPIALVAGQVEGDASLAYGSPEIIKNDDLLKAVRAKMPEAFILFKPHPDVLSGNRSGSVSQEVSDCCIDLLLGDYDIQDCLEIADSVHVMTSGAGLEALVQGKEVHCYGLPFYAGWGLTIDHLSCNRRRRKLSLANLIYATYIAYPTYVSWPSGELTSAEKILNDLLKSKVRKQESVLGFGLKGRLKGVWRKIRNLTEALVR